MNMIKLISIQNHDNCNGDFLNLSELAHGFQNVLLDINKYVGPPYCRAEMYAGHVTCCPSWVTVSMLMGEIDRRTDARELHYALHLTWQT